MFINFPAIPLAFAAILISFILVTLTTFSVPFAPGLYFLHTSQAGGTKFGLWGWCLDPPDGLCSSPPELGYAWEPQIAGPTAKALVFYPITMVMLVLTLISMMPLLCARTTRSDRVFRCFAWATALSSAFAYFFTKGIFGIAKKRFEQRGFEASYGPLPWLSLVAMFLLLGAAIGSHFFPPPPQNTTKATWVEEKRTQRPRRRGIQRRDLESQRTTASEKTPPSKPAKSAEVERRSSDTIQVMVVEPSKEVDSSENLIVVPEPARVKRPRDEKRRRERSHSNSRENRPRREGHSRKNSTSVVPTSERKMSRREISGERPH